MSVEILSSKSMRRKLFQKYNMSYRSIKMFYDKFEIKGTINKSFDHGKNERKLNNKMKNYFLTNN